MPQPPLMQHRRQTSMLLAFASVFCLGFAPGQPDEQRLSEAPSPRAGAAARVPECRTSRAIVVHKSKRLLELLCEEKVVARYPVSLGFAPSGHKSHEGDGRTPEGEYLITGKWKSRFHRTLQIGYPNLMDAERGLASEQITPLEYRRIVRANRQCRLAPQTTKLGSYLQVHGGGGGLQQGDWTLGCVALDNRWIEHVFAYHRPGCRADGKPITPLRIFP